jgi:hypothetical protein
MPDHCSLAVFPVFPKWSFFAAAVRRPPRLPQNPLWLFVYGLPAAIRAAAIFFSPSRADLAMRGFAISLVTLARVVSLDSFLVFFFIGPPP